MLIDLEIFHEIFKFMGERTKEEAATHIGLYLEAVKRVRALEICPNCLMDLSKPRSCCPTKRPQQPDKCSKSEEMELRDIAAKAMANFVESTFLMNQDSDGNLGKKFIPHNDAIAMGWQVFYAVNRFWQSRLPKREMSNAFKNSKKLNTSGDHVQILNATKEALWFVRTKVVSNPETIRHFMVTGEKALEHNMRLLQGKVDDALRELGEVEPRPTNQIEGDK